MSTLTYNGILLGQVQTLVYQEKKIYDGPNYLWDEVSIVVLGVLNPNSLGSYRWANYVLSTDPQTANISASNPSLNGGVSFATSGTGSAAKTERAIRQFLRQPRQKLRYTVGADEIISCPADGDSTDANNGPQPQIVQIKRVAGTKTFYVLFGVTCYINESYNISKPAAILSHLWSESISYTPNFLAIRTRKGRAVFNQAALLGTPPDSFRTALALSPIPGYRRELPQFTLSPDNSVLEYTLVDKEQMYVLDSRLVNSGIADVDCSITQELINPGREAGTRNVLQATLSAVSPSGVFGGIGAVSNIITTTIDNLPTTNRAALVKVTGNRACVNPNTLLSYATFIGASLMLNGGLGSINAVMTAGGGYEKKTWVPKEYAVAYECAWRLGPRSTNQSLDGPFRLSSNYSGFLRLLTLNGPPPNPVASGPPVAVPVAGVIANGVCSANGGDFLALIATILQPPDFVVPVPPVVNRQLPQLPLA